jgi:hypothetical protein
MQRIPHANHCSQNATNRTTTTTTGSACSMKQRCFFLHGAQVVTNKEVEIWDQSKEVEIWDQSPTKDRRVTARPDKTVRFATKVEIRTIPNAMSPK